MSGATAQAVADRAGVDVSCVDISETCVTRITFAPLPNFRCITIKGSDRLAAADAAVAMLRRMR